MRWTLSLLLVLNLALFSWWQGWFSGRVGDGAGAQAESAAQRLRVVPIDRLGGPVTGSVPLTRQAPEPPSPGGAPNGAAGADTSGSS